MRFPNYTRQLLKLSLAGLALVFACVFLLASPIDSVVQGKAVDRESIVLPTPKPTPRPQAKARRYTEFSHSAEPHKIACSSCHSFPSANWKKVRSGDDAFPDVTDYPKHASCINCHKQQFFRGASPAICTICHTNPGPRNSERHPFPNPREIFDKSPKGTQAVSDFAIAFPHEIHVEIVSQLRPQGVEFRNASWRASRRAEESCAVCHKTLSPQGDSDIEYFTKPPEDLGDAFWLKKGTFKSSPIGHSTCFTCHSVDSGMSPAPTDCATCHKLKEPLGPVDFEPELARRIGVTDRVLLDAWRTRTSSGTFRHEWMSHADLSCATCHDVAKLVTNDQKTKKVPIVSCNTCHITETSDEGGILNFEIDARKKDAKFQCVKCHISFGTKPIPESHFKAIAGLAGN